MRPYHPERAGAGYPSVKMKLSPSQETDELRSSKKKFSSLFLCASECPSRWRAFRRGFPLPNFSVFRVFCPIHVAVLLNQKLRILALFENTVENGNTFCHVSISFWDSWNLAALIRGTCDPSSWGPWAIKTKLLMDWVQLLVWRSLRYKYFPRHVTGEKNTRHELSALFCLCL